MSNSSRSASTGTVTEPSYADRVIAADRVIINADRVIAAHGRLMRGERNVPISIGIAIVNLQVTVRFEVIIY